MAFYYILRIKPQLNRNPIMLRLALCIVVTASFYSNLFAQKLPAQPEEINPKLPNVLLIGDSISIGYTRPVRKKLSGVANVFRPNTNCGPTTKGVSELDKWLGDRKWSVIHFNHGLHDLKYMGPNKNLAVPRIPNPINKCLRRIRSEFGKDCRAIGKDCAF